MDARDRLHILTWPFHNGLRDVSLGSGPIRLADDPILRAGIEAEAWTVTTEEIEAVDESDPEENASGFFDVMGRAMLTGRGWRALRDLEDYERERLNHSHLATIPGPIDPERFEKALTALHTRVERVYLHVDLDSLDTSEARANRYAAPGGPGLVRLLECIRLTGERLEIAGAAITAYDPAFDPDDRAVSAAGGAAHEIARVIRSQPTSGTG